MTNRVTVEIICDGPDCTEDPYVCIGDTCHLSESKRKANQTGWQVLSYKALCPKCNVNFYLETKRHTTAVLVLPRPEKKPP